MTIERGGDVHPSRLDDQMASEVQGLLHASHDEGRTDGRRQEDLVGEPGVNEGSHRQDVGPVAPGLTERDLDLRAALAGHLAGLAFPATSELVRETARADNAPDDVLAIIERLPPGRTYEAMGEIWVDVGGTDEHRT